jgi:hypothetical protein
MLTVSCGGDAMHTLYSYPELFGVADNNGYGLKVFAFLRLAGVPFRHEHIFDASSAPRGQQFPCKLDQRSPDERSDIWVVSTGTTKPAPVGRVYFLSPTGALAWRVSRRRNAPYCHRSGTSQSPNTQRTMRESL